MLKFISLGSSSSGNCYYLFTDTDSLLIDAGIGVRSMKKRFHEYGLSFSDIKHIIITHDHADHVKSVGSLSQSLNLPIYATARVHEGIRRNYCVKAKLAPDMQKIIEKDVPFQLGEFNITAFDVPHDSLDCVGYKIVVDGLIFTLITDVGTVTDKIRQMIGQANYLVLEANHEDTMLKAYPNYSQHLKDRIRGPRGHLSNYECGVALAENSTPALRQVWLCHLSEKTNTMEVASATVKGVLRDYGIVAGLDFKLDVLERRGPSGIYELK